MSAVGLESRPYIGLRYFEERDAHLFYGRDEHVAQLLGKLADRRFVAVIGSSGCGKSSLVRAGLLPELRSGMIPKAGPRWKVVEFKPGIAPLKELSDAIRATFGVENAADLVEQGPLGIARAVAEAKLDQKTNVLIVADQFEEVFRFQREQRSQGRGREAAEQCHALARRLLDAAAQTELPIYVLLVMRSDYLGDCTQFPDLPERMSESLYLIPRLRRGELQEAITAPVGGAIDSAVVQRLLGEIGNDPDQLPRLQHLLGRMWDRASGGRLTMAHYDLAGGWEKGLEQHLDEVHNGLSDSHLPICRRLFQQLSEVDKGRAVRRRSEIAELVRVCGSDVSLLVAAFRSEGFLAPQENPVDLTHECILREWPKLKLWMEQEQRDAKRLGELAEAAKDAGWRTGLSAEQEKSIRGMEGLTLQNLAAWRDGAQPTAAWAERYVTAVDFHTADSYLSWSQALDQQQKIRVRYLESQAVQAEKFRRTRLLLGLAGLLLVALAWNLLVQRGLTRSAKARELTLYATQFQTENPARALYIAVRTARMGGPTPPGLEAVLATALTNGASRAVLSGHAGKVVFVTWSPDGETLASAGDDGTILLWDAANGRALRTLRGHQSAVLSMAWSPDGKTLAVASIDGTVQMWEQASGQPPRTLQGPQGKVLSVAWSLDGKTFASASADGTIRLSDAASGQPLRVLQDHRSPALSVAWSPDGKTLASAGDDGTILLWDAAGGRPPRTLKGHLSSVVSLAWSPDGKTLASTSADGTVQMWEPLTSGQPPRTLQGQQGNVVAWSPDGKTLGSASADGVIRLWNASSAQPLRTLRGHQDSVLSVAWSPDGKTFASASADRMVRLWDANSGQPLRTLQGHQDSVVSVAWSPDGKTLASASADRTVGLWDAAGVQPPGIRMVLSPVVSVAWSPDGKTLASASADGMVRLWDAAGGQQLPLRTLQGHQDSVVSVAWSPDGKTLASASADGTVQMWEPASGRPLGILPEQQGYANSVAWSPDGKTLASVVDDGTVRLRDAASGQLLRTLQGQQAKVNSVAWSPDGSTLASASTDGTVQTWEPGSGRLLHTLQGKQGSVNSVAWSPDGKTLASASADRTILLWDAASGQLLRTLHGHQDSVLSVAWSPDGKTLASASADRTILLWPGTMDVLLSQARDRIRLFSLSEEECQRYFSSNSCKPVQ